MTGPTTCPAKDRSDLTCALGRREVLDRQRDRPLSPPPGKEG